MILKALKSHRERLAEQINQYKHVENMHQQLSDIFTYWQQNYFRKRFVEVTGCNNYIEFYGRHLMEAAQATGIRRFVSFGCGDGAVEATVAKYMTDQGLTDFTLEGVELSPYQIERAWANVDRQGLRDCFAFTEADFNTWEPPEPYAGAMAHHALHHVQDLEHLFDSVKSGLHEDGVFVTFDVIGRNGHMRWPEVLEIIERIWAFLPDEKKVHQILKVTDESYVNRDCSVEGFEGIRAQDILPLLVERFHFRTFLGFGNLVDMFTSRGFGPNWNADDPKDRAFIDFVEYLNELLIDLDHIKPTRMCAVMGLKPTQTRVYKNWTPEFCVRAPSLPFPDERAEDAASETAS